MSEVLILPWPSKKLSPNARSSTWHAKAGATKKYRRDCYLLTRASGISMPYGRAELYIRFCPPNNRRRDVDNLLASMKAAFDGIAQALNVDDSRFVLRIDRDMGPIVVNGRVEITFSALPEK